MCIRDRSNTTQQIAIETYQSGFNGAPKYGATPTGYYLKKFVDGNCVTTANNQTTTCLLYTSRCV